MEQDSFFSVAFLLSTCLIYVISMSIFYSFTKALRHFLKYIAAFEKEVLSIHGNQSTIRPRTELFHMQRPEIKNRFCVSRTLTFSAAIIFVLLTFKFGLEVYRLLFSENVNV